jgi:peptidoglycan hydrolase-like protein with peptidoglycan-binding domain
MAFIAKSLAAVAFLALLPLGACATDRAYGGVDGQAARAQGYQEQGYQGDGAYAGQTASASLTVPVSHDGLLSSPPNNARPGECYAKVVVPGQPIGAPPSQPRAVWVQTPPGPGQVSPTWCLYYEPGAPQPVAWTPERYGWIRVVCDRDITEDKIRHMQRRLHEWGDYDGAYDGHYDTDTAKAVARFQEQRHIDHGGYLSVKTVEALDAAPQPALVPAFDAGHPNPNPPVVAQNTYATAQPTVYASPIYQQPSYPPTYGSPCGQTSCAPPAPPAPPQIIYQRQVVIQPVIQRQIIRQPVIVQQQVVQPMVQTVIQPQFIPQSTMMNCGQPACMPQPSPCGGPVCGAQSGPNWGGPAWGGPQQSGPYGQAGTPPYRSLLSWPGKTVY